MRVILLQDVKTLGKKNDVKDVSDGYARNFLFPRNLAKFATEQTLKTLTIQKEKEEKENSQEFQKFKALVERLKTVPLTFKVKIGERGRAFGSVTPLKIKEALKKQGIEIEKDWILLEESIKTAGESMVKIKLPQGLVGEVRIIVEKEI